MSGFDEISLIVGLGNPGKKYADTRHNAGWWFIEHLTAQFQFALKPEARFQGLFGEFRFEQRVIRVLAPTTFMNHSGRSVVSCASYYKIKPNQIMVIHDEIDLIPGDCRIKFKGGHGGHNGLRDICKSLDTADFVRLRLGVGHPKSASMVINYVLSKPSSSELAQINWSIDRSMKVMELLLSGELERAIHQLHTKDQTLVESN
ncbi:MAG: aminoacyl-tRNA hydrolase [Gammaproteobacteria bacterium]|nr:aminoacyl-tRNA hydrolase [Gammaproteobacteria bacterium]